MPTFDAIFAHFPAFALVLARLTGLFIFAPLLSSPVLPRQFKVLLALGLGAVLYPTVQSLCILPAHIDLFGLAPLMASELFIGLCIGVLASIPLMTAQLAGVIMGQQMGIGLASVYNPAADFDADAIGQILYYVALASFLAAGGLETVYDTLVSTFARVPIGSFSAMSTPIDTLASIVTSGFAVALRISMPVLLILMLETVAVGFIMKTVPALNIMSVGFPIRILLGTLLLVSSLTITVEVLMQETGRDLDAVRAWSDSLTPRSHDSE